MPKMTNPMIVGRRIALLPREIEKSLINQGRIMAALNRRERFDDLSDYEFQVFSQWGEDGIIQHLVEAMPGIPRQFIEFGVESFTECNSRFLMMKDGWSGFIIDGSEKHVADIQSRHWYWQHDLTAHCAFIDKDNIASLLDKSGFFPEPGILSVDIDGVDWFVLEALGAWKPWIVIVEYNGLFGPEAPVSVPYDPAFVRHQKHYSGLYWGASLAAFDTLLAPRGYRLAGTNRAGSNAFFVRTDKVQGHVPSPTREQACRPVIFRDVRDEQGKLQFINQRERARVIADMPLVNTVTGATLAMRDLNLG
ncbi:MAG: hypothetical protein K2Y03_03825 [Sphingomonas sp.]|nr:hypothetical protein [Sphingomonas sp.]